jgi:hypothetical protein
MDRGSVGGDSLTLRTRSHRSLLRRRGVELGEADLACLPRPDRRAAAGPEEGFVSPCHSRERDFTFYAGVVYRERPTTFPTGMVCFELPAHESAVGVVAGDRAETERVYAQLPTWAAGQGRSTTKELLSLERYSAAGPTLDDSGVFAFEVWIPIDDRATDPSDRERPPREVSHRQLPVADTASAASS